MAFVETLMIDYVEDSSSVTVIERGATKELSTAMVLNKMLCMITVSELQLFSHTYIRNAQRIR